MRALACFERSVILGQSRLSNCDTLTQGLYIDHQAGKLLPFWTLHLAAGCQLCFGADPPELLD